MSNTLTFTEEKIKSSARRMKTELDQYGIDVSALGHAKAIDVLSKALFGKPYDEVRKTALLAESEPSGGLRVHTELTPEYQESAQASIQEYVRLFTQGFIIDHFQEIASALKNKAMNTNLDLEVELYQEAWDEVERFTEETSETQVWVALSGLTAEARESIEQMLRDQGRSISGSAVASYLYEEATKDVLVTFLRDLNEESNGAWFMEHLTDLKAIRALTEKAAKECVPAWLRG